MKPSSPNGSPILPTIVVFLPSPSEYSPVSMERLPPSRLSLRMKLITPAMASEPYCADAPSRSTSILPIAEAGIVAISGFWVPLPPIETSAERWRRFEFIKTRVLSVGSPRRLAGRMNVAPSEMGCRDRLNEGTSVLKISLVSV